MRSATGQIEGGIGRSECKKTDLFEGDSEVAIDRGCWAWTGCVEVGTAIVCARRQTSSGGLEKKAWATSATAKCMQGEFLCLAHNLMVLHEDLLLREHGIVNEAENRRREKRLKKEQETARKAGRAVPLLRQALQRCTQRTVKFVRWLRAFMFRDAPWTAILDALRRVYRTP